MYHTGLYYDPFSPHPPGSSVQARSGVWNGGVCPVVFDRKGSIMRDDDQLAVSSNTVMAERAAASQVHGLQSYTLRPL